MKSIIFSTEDIRAILDGHKSITRYPVKITSSNDSENGFGFWKHYNQELKRWSIKDHTHSTLWYGEKEYISRFGKYQIGDILYVRETWCESRNKYYYKAEQLCIGCDDTGTCLPNGTPGTEVCEVCEYSCGAFKWHSSVCMPKEAARIFLKVTDVKVERLQDIAKEHAINEGIRHIFDHLSKSEYENWAKRVGVTKNQNEQPWNNYLWHGHYGKYGTGGKLSDNWSYQYSGYDNPVDSFSSLWNSKLKLDKWDNLGWDQNPWIWVIEFERISKEDV